MAVQIVFLIMGFAWLIWPELLAGKDRKAHARRLADLRSGQPEAFFEEQRALEAYPPEASPVIWRRLLGGLMVLTAVAFFVLDRLPLGGQGL